MRLRRSQCDGPGITRRRRGRGFSYVDGDGRKVSDPEVLARIHELVTPPAWEDVWICPYPGGHIQATGVDQRGRKQYLYHPRWRERQDQKKFDAVLVFAHGLPELRELVDRDLARGDLSREHVMACAIRLLDTGFFRIGSEDYAASNQSYGLATILKSHVEVTDDLLTFDYPAKSGKRREQQVADPPVLDVVTRLKRRRGGGEELLAFKEGRRWRDVRSPDINAYLKDVSGMDISAKDFRTWGATVKAAVGLAVIQPERRRTKTARKRAIAYVVADVAETLGNTPAVARASYIDPRLFDRFRDGQTIADMLGDLASGEHPTAIQGPAEQATLELLDA